MDKVRMNYYLDMVPIEIRHSIKQLNNDQKWAIYIALMQEDKKTFTDIRKDFGANPGEITRALKSLNDGGLIEKRVAKLSESGDSRKILYCSTSHGKSLLNCFYDSICIHNNISLAAGRTAALTGYSIAQNPLKKMDAQKNLKIESTIMGSYTIGTAEPRGV